MLVVSLINAFQLFPQIMIMTDGGPNGATQVMVERIYKYGFRYYRMGYAAAFSWLLFVIIMACRRHDRRLLRSVHIQVTEPIVFASIIADRR